jgi:hypothetical protein
MRFDFFDKRPRRFLNGWRLGERAQLWIDHRSLARRGYGTEE